MAEVKFGELRSVVEAVRQIVLDWDGFVSNVEALAREHDEYRQAADRHAWELGELRAAHERLADEREEARGMLASLRANHESLTREHTRLERECQDAQRALASLQASQDALTRERDRLTKELVEMRSRHESVMLERHRAGEELEAILRRFRASA